MKTSHYKVIGIALLAGVILAAIAFQVFGSGLVSTRPPAPARVIIIQGHTVTQTFSEVTVYHAVRILALGSIALLGFACILRGRSHETNA
jgi:hypothetical protein